MIFTILRKFCKILSNTFAGNQKDCKKLFQKKKIGKHNKKCKERWMLK